MSKSLLLLAAAFAVILSACSEGGGGSNNLIDCKLSNGNTIQVATEEDCRKAGGIPDLPPITYNGYCVVQEMRICVSSTEEECFLVSEVYTSYSRTCPSGYDSSPKACYFNDWDDYGCEPITSSFSESQCSRYGGNPMDLGTCLRGIGVFTTGSCEAYWGECINNVSQYDCNMHYEGHFTPNGSCPATVYGSCTLDGYCYSNISQYECLYEGGTFVTNGTCGGGNSYGSCTFQGQCYSNISQSDCSSVKGSFVPNGTCGGGNSNYGSCTWPSYGCAEDIYRYDCGGDEEVFASNGTCSTTSFPYCYYGEDCDRVGGRYMSSKSSCLYYEGVFVTRLFCEENGISVYDD